ncbi:vWA domain-containing protein [Corynebacterium minutissimum]|uniref:vWA domain-containing protein n=1 Tax=Corynebacterium minutissimum TaxID=38301 RepID=UPI001EF28083|nr:VWA domain-containing protein [Corynebacterium minutissimum]MCG7230540.1 VWA domain-containing protein [Corynebacterium minutissimum]MCG7239690.1 VWA domain-containing protein [Corynebacterium minutissimum]
MNIPPRFSPNSRVTAALAFLAATVIASVAGLFPVAVADDKTAESLSPSTSSAPSSSTTMAPTMVVFDSSGSMITNDAGGQTRIDAAKDAARTFITEAGDDAPLGLVTYGGNTGEAPEDEAAGCQDITVVTPPEAGNSEKMISHMDGLQPRGFTPIGESLRKAAAELPKEGQRSIILVSDGVATCTPPPVCEVAKELKEQGIDLVINTVGFNVEPEAQQELQCIADATGGTYADASDADSLAKELRRAAPRAYNAYESELEEIEGGKTESSPAKVDRDVEAFSTTLLPTEGEGHSAESATFFTTPIAEGERVVISANTTQAPSINNFRKGGSLHLGVSSVELSCKLDTATANDIAVNQYQTATLYSTQGGEEGCDSDELAFTIERAGDWKQDEELGAEVTITRFGEPDMNGQPDPAEEKVEPGTVTASGDPTEVAPGTWFTDAAELTPQQPVRAQIVPGETHFYRIPVEHGQQLAGKVSMVEEADDFENNHAGDNLIVTGYNEARTEIYLEGRSASIQKDSSGEFSYPAPILFANRYGGSHNDGSGIPGIESVWQGGEQYLAINYEKFHSTQEINENTQLPVLTYDLVVDAFGDPVPEPTFAPVKVETEKPSEAPEPTAQDNSANQAQSKDDPSFFSAIPLPLIGGLGLLVLLGLIIALVLVIRSLNR